MISPIVMYDEVGLTGRVRHVEKYGRLILEVEIMEEKVQYFGSQKPARIKSWRRAKTMDLRHPALRWLVDAEFRRAATEAPQPS